MSFVMQRPPDAASGSGRRAPAKAPGGPNWSPRRARLHAAAWLAALALVTVLAAALRLYRYDALSLWLDEVTSYGLAANLTWPRVLGLAGRYDTHPPLFYVLLKAVLAVIQRPEDARLLSVIAGTATVPLLYAVAASLLDRPAALVAAALLAISPIHVWYSQELRQYAVLGLLVTLSYLALVRFAWTPRPRWTVLYGVATALAPYVDYSASYALAPQTIFLLLVLARHRRRAWPIVAAAITAALLFLPWLPQIARTAQDQTSAPDGDTSLPSLPRLLASLLALLGLFGGSTSPHPGGYFYSPIPAAWDAIVRWERPAFLPIWLALLVGLAVCLRRSPLAAVVPIALAGGTVASALALGRVFPLYWVERAVLSATLGLVILLGASVGRRVDWRLRYATVVGVFVVAAMNLSTLDTIYSGADKQHFRELSVDAARLTGPGQRLVTYPGPMAWAVQMYGRSLPPGTLIHLPDWDPLPADEPAPDRDAAVWLSYLDLHTRVLPIVRDQLALRGYVPLLHRPYGDPLYLDLYALPAAPLGQELLPAPAPGAAWEAPPAGLQPASRLDPGTTVAVPPRTAISASLPAPDPASGLYVLRYEAQADAPDTTLTTTLICLPFTDVRLPSSLDVALAADWRTAGVAALCPATTTSLRLELRAAGDGSVHLRRLSLQGPPN